MENTDFAFVYSRYVEDLCRPKDVRLLLASGYVPVFFDVLVEHDYSYLTIHQENDSTVFNLSLLLLTEATLTDDHLGRILFLLQDVLDKSKSNFIKDQRDPYFRRRLQRGMKDERHYPMFSDPIDSMGRTPRDYRPFQHEKYRLDNFKSLNDFKHWDILNLDLAYSSYEDFVREEGFHSRRFECRYEDFYNVKKEIFEPVSYLGKFEVFEVEAEEN